jgi:2-isopropylmalate synthase
MFATEAGIHQDGLIKHPDTYLPYPPEKVGAPGIMLVLGKHSGRAAFSERLASLGIVLGEGELDRVIALAKDAPKEAWQDDAGVLTSAVATARATAAE